MPAFRLGLTRGEERRMSVSQVQMAAGARREAGGGRVGAVHTVWRKPASAANQEVMEKADLIRALDETAARDAQVADGLALVGYPEPRLSPHGFPTLLNIIVSQQISRDAANAIRARVEALYPSGDAAAFLRLDDDALRAAGLSRPKVKYARALAAAIADGTLDLDAVARMPDAEAVAAIMALKGFGRWSAEIYCMFSLRRPDFFPGEDIALQEAMRRLKGLDARPDAKTARQLAEAWSPWRTAMSVFLWHYYRGAPQN